MMEDFKFNQNIDVTKLEDIDCDNCESTGFIPVYTLKILPAILSPSGTQQIIPVFQRFECIDCGFAVINEN